MISETPKLQVGGTLVPDRDLYIPRPEDEELFAALREREYVNIVSSRQVGKSSAMVRAALRLRAEGWRFAVVDLTSLGTPPDADGYFQGLIKGLAAGLKLKVDVPAFWAAHAGDTASQRLIAFFRDVVLTEIDGPVAIFLDEIDSTLKLPYTDDLFTALRAIYNERTLVEAWRRLVFCLVGVATPNELVKDRRTTPYNIGRTVWVGDFDPARDDLATLAAALHADPATAQPLLARVLYWTGGHPFLTLRLVKDAREAGAADPPAVDALVERSFARLDRLGEDVHIQSILRFVAERLSDGGATLALYERILGGTAEPDQPTLTHAELKLSGLVRRGPDGRLAVRNRIYARLFDRSWVRASRPLQAARRYRGAAIAAGIALLLTVGGGTAWYNLRLSPEIAGLQNTVAARETLQRLNISLGEDGQGRLTANFPADAPQTSLAEAIPQLQALRMERGTPRALALDLAGTRITDLAPLAALDGIEKLDLSRAPPESLASLPALPDLRELDLSGSQVRDLSPLVRQPALESLDLGWTPVARLDALTGLPKLRRLVLAGTAVTDLTPLTALPDLQELDLSARPSSGLESMQLIPTLRALHVGVEPVRTAITHPDGQVFRDRRADGGECADCPKMVVIPAGTFAMGSTAEERQWYVAQGGTEDEVKDEQPRHEVRIAQPFALGRTEVTRGQFAAFVNATGYRPEDGCYTWTGSTFEFDRSRNWQDPGFTQTDLHPAVCVSWNDARAFAAWLTVTTGQPYRLPSEAEWEYAARAGTTTVRYWGDDPSNELGCKFANVGDRSAKEKFTDWTVFDCDDGQIFTSPVASYLPNAFGGYDLLGNVFEWLQDCYEGSYDGAPFEGIQSLDKNGCPERVLRGGSWYGFPRFLRSALRSRSAPDDRYDVLGFRVARMLTP